MIENFNFLSYQIEIPEDTDEEEIYKEIYDKIRTELLPPLHYLADISLLTKPLKDKGLSENEYGILLHHIDRLINFLEVDMNFVEYSKERISIWDYLIESMVNIMKELNSEISRLLNTNTESDFLHRLYEMKEESKQKQPQLGLESSDSKVFNQIILHQYLIEKDYPDLETYLTPEVVEEHLETIKKALDRMCGGGFTIPLYTLYANPARVDDYANGSNDEYNVYDNEDNDSYGFQGNYEYEED